MGVLTDRPPHKGYPGIIRRSKTFEDFVREELQRMYDDAVRAELSTLFNVGG